MTEPDFEEILGVAPARIVRPTTVNEVAELVAAAHAAGESVVPWGGGMGQDFGAPPRKVDLLLDLSGLDAILAHEFADMTVTVQAGVTLARLQEQLAEHHQFLPIDAPQPEQATIGGVLATNAFGPKSLGYGTARDWLIGLTVVDAQGRLIKGGGKVVKNVTGYDTPKLHIGALGTLGIIVEATFKVSPEPEAARTVIGRWDDSLVLDGLLELLRKRDPVQILSHEDARGQYLVVVFHGIEEAVMAAAEAAQADFERFGIFEPTIYDEELEAEVPPMPLVVRLVGKPADTWALRLAVLSAIKNSGAVIDAFLGLGSVTVSWETTTELACVAMRTLAAHARLHDLAFTVLHAPLELRTEPFVPIWYPLPSAMPLMKRLKTTLDPNSTLNPGRFLGGI